MPTSRSKAPTFFGREARATASVIGKKHRRYFSAFRATAEFGTDVLLGVSSPRGDRQRVLSAALLGRLLNSTQASALLSRQGLQHDAAALIRVSFEVLLNLKGCCGSTDFVHRYVAAEKMRRLKLARAALRDPGGSLTESEKSELQKKEEHLAAEVKVNNVCEPRIEATAREVGLSGYYDTVYRLTSPAVHAVAGILPDFAVLRNELEFGPRDTHTAMYLYTAADFLLLGTEAFCVLFDLDRDRDVNRLRRRLNALTPEWHDLPGGP